MAAFAAEDGDEPGSANAPIPRRAAMLKEAQASLAQIGNPSRPASAPVFDQRSDSTPPISKYAVATPSDPSVSSITYQPTPRVRSSSPSMPSSSSVPRQLVNMPQLKKRHSPMRSIHRSDTSTSTSTLPTLSVFNPSLGSIPAHSQPNVSPLAHLPIGSKRAHQQVDYEMAENEQSNQAVSPVTPSGRSHRSSKRRSVGTGLARGAMSEDGAAEEKERDNKRKGGRRGQGQGGGQSGVY